MLYIWRIKSWGGKLKQTGKGHSGRQVTEGLCKQNLHQNLWDHSGAEEGKIL